MLLYFVSLCLNVNELKALFVEFVEPISDFRPIWMVFPETPAKLSFNGRHDRKSDWKNSISMYIWIISLSNRWKNSLFRFVAFSVIPNGKTDRSKSKKKSFTLHCLKLMTYELRKTKNQKCF